jgi:hypothetical protein
MFIKEIRNRVQPTNLSAQRRKRYIAMGVKNSGVTFAAGGKFAAGVNNAGGQLDNNSKLSTHPNEDLEKDKVQV